MPGSDTKRTALRDVHAAAFGLGAAAVLTTVIALLGERLAHFRLTPIDANFWYAWQLETPNPWTRVSAWVPYVLHQLGIWGLIYYAQTRIGRYSPKLHWVNLAALALNFGFGALHIVQTHLFYDGLAQDVHEASSLLSVVFMLVIVILMENRRRGVFFGRRLPISDRMTDFLRRYHGYYFSWAITYTFWYHPAVATPGHLAGFAYMFLLFIQGSLFFTQLHKNRWWTCTVEAAVIVHSVAVTVADPMFPTERFLFGWLSVFVFTQMHGLGLSILTRTVLFAVYAVALVATYASLDLSRIHEALRVPMGLVVGGLVTWLVLRLAFKLSDLITGGPHESDPPAGSDVGNGSSASNVA